ncbi:hypothetical protein [Bacillus sp. FJAT-45350]|uniref:hypothetical protein n=1 Tax=Bacillus sp. FJAT-45350 TaxID=2011014 RepID=UPI000BB85623|nr:hypothetical protein [Bacillus sp. FJAT-45350]
MIYNAKNPLFPLVILLVISVSSTSRTSPLTPWWIEILGFLMILLTISLIFINYKVKIDNDKLEYTVNLHKLQILKKCLKSSQISEIKFKRFGWGKKGAVVKVVDKMNIRVVDFYPPDIYNELIEFANNNNLKIHKTKDYKLLERYF